MFGGIMNSRYRIPGILLTLLGGISWGFSGTVGQYLFTVEGMDSRWLVPIRLGSAGIIMLLIYALRFGKEVMAPWRERSEIGELLIYGLIGISGCQFTYFLTIQLSTAAIATILQNLAPIWILIYTCIIGKRMPVISELVSIALALFGVALIASHGNPAMLLSSSGALISGSICALCVLVYNVAPARIMRKHPVFLLQGWAFFMGGIVASLIFRPWSYGYVPSIRGLMGIAFVVLVGNIVAFTTYMTGVKMIGPDRAVLYGFSEPICAAVLGTLLFGNPFTPADALGFLCVFAMLVMISFSSLKG